MKYQEIVDYMGIETPTWRRLRRYGGNKLIKSSYIWVAIVPVAAKLVPQLETMLSIFGGDIVLSLPFSWQMFYFGSIFFAIASFIYQHKCPYLIQKYHIPDEYWNSGHGLRELDNYASLSFSELDESTRGETLQEYHSIKPKIFSGNTDDRIKAERNSKFFYIQEKTQYKRENWRLMCGLNYLVGFIFFFLVLMQNFIYVFKQLVLGSNG